jgi:hypothetical protein
MKAKPMGMLVLMPAGWINRHQQDVTVYLKEENKILREKLGTKRILLRISMMVLPTLDRHRDHSLGFQRMRPGSAPP